MRKWYFILFVLILSSLSSQAQQCCYCEMGTFPQKEKKFFRMGCQNWLSKQKNCSIKKIVEHGYDYSNQSLVCGASQLNIGYVGHWSDSEQTINYLDSVVLPAVHVHRLKVKIDNTACRGMDQPAKVQRYLAQVSGRADIAIRGNQVISVGEWDRIFGPSYNLWATASTTTSEVQYPPCQKFENKTCLMTEQAGEEGFCLDRREQIKNLKCCVQTQEEIGSSPSYLWSEPGVCLN